MDYHYAKETKNINTNQSIEKSPSMTQFPSRLDPVKYPESTIPHNPSVAETSRKRAYDELESLTDSSRWPSPSQWTSSPSPTYLSNDQMQKPDNESYSKIQNPIVKPFDIEVGAIGSRLKKVRVESPSQDEPFYSLQSSG